MIIAFGKLMENMLFDICDDEMICGTDEAGRGPLAGPVVAAAVVLPRDFPFFMLADSKKMSERKRLEAESVIKEKAIAWATAAVSHKTIDRINILKASFLAMHRALDLLKVRPEAVIVDGNRFVPYRDLPYTTVVKGDGKYQAIAAASILAKTFRDDYMKSLHREYPCYGWDGNKGYPTAEHRRAIREHGVSPYHRMSYNLLGNGFLAVAHEGIDETGDQFAVVFHVRREFSFCDSASSHCM